MPVLPRAGGPRFVRRLVWGLAAVALGAGACRKGASAPDSGPAVPLSPSMPADAGGTLPGPPAPPTGPRLATPAAVERFADLTALGQRKEYRPLVRLVREATRDVHANAAFAAEVERATGEPLRPPQTLVLERMEVGPGPQLWRLTYEAWCGRSTGESAGYKSDHLILSRAGGVWRSVASFRRGCDESGDPEITLVDFDGDGREDVALGYASTRLGVENRLELRWLKRTAQGFTAVPLLKESSQFQTLEVRYQPAPGGGRDLHFRTFRADAASCAFFEVTVVYALDRAKGRYRRGPEQRRPVPPKALIDEGEDIDPRCEPK